MMIIIGVLFSIFIILFFKEQIRALLTIMIRGCLYLAFIWSINQVLFYFGIAIEVGLGPISFLTCAILGFPGACTLFGLYFL